VKKLVDVLQFVLTERVMHWSKERNMKKVATIVFMCLLSAHVFGQDLFRHVNEQHGFSLSYPADWLVEEAATKATVFKAVKRVADGQYFMFTVNVQLLDRDDYSMSDYTVDDMIGVARTMQGTDNVTVLGSSRGEIDGVPYIKLLLDTHSQGIEPRVGYFIYAINNKYLYTVTVSCNRKLHQQHARQIKQLGDSFAFSVPQEVPIGTAPKQHSATNEIRFSDEILKNTFRVFALTAAQDRSLDAIISQFPDLSQDARMARIEFNRAFAPAVKALDEFLTGNSTPDWHWPTVKQEQLDAAVERLDFSGISRQQALDYIATVRKRTKGHMPQETYNVLIAFHPLYQTHPHLEFLNGYVREYRSDGRGKALGLKIALEHPMSWKAEEGRRPHILQKFASTDSLASATISLNDVPFASKSFSEQENLQYLSSREYIEKEMHGARFISAGATTIAGKQASFCNVTIQRSAPAGDLTLRARIYYILHKEKVVAISFDVARVGLLSLKDIEPIFDRYEKLFELIASSVDFFDKYESAEQHRQAANVSTPPLSHRRNDAKPEMTNSGEKPLPALVKAFGQTWLKCILAAILFAGVAAIWAKIRPKKRATDTPDEKE